MLSETADHYMGNVGEGYKLALFSKVNNLPPLMTSKS